MDHESLSSHSAWKRAEIRCPVPFLHGGMLKVRFMCSIHTLLLTYLPLWQGARDYQAHDSGPSALKVLTVLYFKMRKCRFGEYTGIAEFRPSELRLEVFLLDCCRRDTKWEGPNE